MWLDRSPQIPFQIVGSVRCPAQLKQATPYYLHANESSDRVLLETLGLKSDKSREPSDSAIFALAVLIWRIKEEQFPAGVVSPGQVGIGADVCSPMSKVKGLFAGVTRSERQRLPVD
jgi:hypothetical protein